MEGRGLGSSGYSHDDDEVLEDESPLRSTGNLANGKRLLELASYGWEEDESKRYLASRERRNRELKARCKNCLAEERVW